MSIDTIYNIAQNGDIGKLAIALWGEDTPMFRRQAIKMFQGFIPQHVYVKLIYEALEERQKGSPERH